MACSCTVVPLAAAKAWPPRENRTSLHPLMPNSFSTLHVRRQMSPQHTHKCAHLDPRQATQNLPHYRTLSIRRSTGIKSQLRGSVCIQQIGLQCFSVHFDVSGSFDGAHFSSSSSTVYSRSLSWKPTSRRPAAGCTATQCSSSTKLPASSSSVLH